MKNSNIQKYYYVFLFCLGCSLVFFLYIDYPLILWLAEYNFFTLKKIFRIITLFGDGWFSVVFVLGLFILCRLIVFFSFIDVTKREYWKKVFFEQSKLLFIFLILGGLVVRVLKISVGRYRPEFFLETGVRGFDSFRLEYQFSSFPSGHTQTVTTLMVCLAFFYPKYKYIFYSLLVLGAISRVVLLAHYPSDILIGFLVGFFFALCVKHFYQHNIGV